MKRQSRGIRQVGLALGIALVSAVAAGVLAGAAPIEDSGPDEQADVQALTVEIAPGVQLLALVDQAHETICFYQYEPRAAGHERLALVAARSYRYDLQLEDYNNAEPTPTTVRQWVERSQRLKQGASGSTVPEPNRTAISRPAIGQPPAGLTRTPAEPGRTQWTTIPETLGPRETPAVTPETVPAEPSASIESIRPEEQIDVSCGATDCDFTITLPGESFLTAAREQLSQVKLRDPARYQRHLALGRTWTEPEASEAAVAELLVHAWGSADKGLPFTCPRCGRDTVYRLDTCEHCGADWIRPKQTEDGPVCPSCEKPVSK